MITIDLFNRFLSGGSLLGNVPTDKPKGGNIERAVYNVAIDKNFNSSYYIDKQVSIYDLKLNGIEMPLAIIEVSVVRYVEKTDLAGLDNTVIEGVGLNNYTIKVKGLIIEDDIFLHPKTDKIKDLFLINDFLTVECEFLRLLDIHFIVVESFVFEPVIGAENAIEFDFVAYRDSNKIDLEL